MTLLKVSPKSLPGLSSSHNFRTQRLVQVMLWIENNLSDIPT